MSLGRAAKSHDQPETAAVSVENGRIVECSLENRVTE
jgi:hypothetical protein